MVAMEVFTVEAFHQLTFMSKLILFEHFQQRIMTSYIFHDLTDCEIEQAIIRAIQGTERKVFYLFAYLYLFDKYCFQANFSFSLSLIVQKQIN